MSAFQSQWLDWEPTETPDQRTDKADKSPSVSSVSSSPGQIQPESASQGERKNTGKTRYPLTDKTDKSLGETVPSVPAEWSAGVASLSTMEPPADWPARRWPVLVSDAREFLATWGAEAHGLDWLALDLFGVHEQR